MTWIDAPVSGGPPSRASASSPSWPAATRRFARVAPILASYAGNVTLMGPAGAGQMAKVINQSITGVGYVLMAEVLRLAEASGIDAARIPDCLAGGHADSTMLRFAYPRMLARDFDPPLSLTRQMLRTCTMSRPRPPVSASRCRSSPPPRSASKPTPPPAAALADTSSIYRLYSAEE